jgi:pseudaminic acid biosynthesis-associated methylase
VTTDDQSSASAGPAFDRLEALWAGAFGDQYLARNQQTDARRAQFWGNVARQYRPRRILEVGCNIGANLKWLRVGGPTQDLFGVDLNASALRRLRHDVPEAHAIRATGRNLPFPDGSFDLVFTMGVLIHQSDDALPTVMAEVVRCSRRLVLCGEYFAAVASTIPYHGELGALFKRDYGEAYQRMFRELSLINHGFLGREQGFDDVTFWMFEKTP